MKAWIIIALALALCAPAFTDEDLTSAKGDYTETTVGVYGPEAHGSQAWVRQYDGRSFVPGIGLESLDSLGYDGDYQYFIKAYDLSLGDQSAYTTLLYKDLYSIDWYSIGLTQRFAPVPSRNPALIGTPADSTTPGTGDYRVNLGGLGDSSGNYYLDRRENNFEIKLTPWQSPQARFYTKLWQVDEDGEWQLQFRAFANSPNGQIKSGQKGLLGVPIDRDTNQNTIGGDFLVGNFSAANYYLQTTKFADGGFTPTPGLNFVPLNTLTKVQSDTTSNVFKYRATISDRLYFTGVATHTNRQDNSTPLSNSTRETIESTNLSLNYLPTDSWTFTGQYRTYTLDNKVPPVVSGGSVENDADSINNRSLQLEGSYSGIRRMYWRFGFERMDQDLSEIPIEAAEDATEFPFVNDRTTTNYWRASFRYYPLAELSVMANGEWTSSNAATFAGTPDQSQNYSFNATYMLNDKLSVYGDFNSHNGNNTRNPVIIASIPTPATTAAQVAIRELAAGEGFAGLLSTTTLGTWYSITPKLTLDLTFSKIIMDAQELWIIGFDQGLGQLLPDFVPFKSNDNQIGFGGNYTLRSKNHFNAHVFYSKSQGADFIDPATHSAALGLGPQWTPTNSWELDYTLGYSRDLTSKDTLQLTFDFEQWHDNINPANDGIFQLSRMAWTHAF